MPSTSKAAVASSVLAAIALLATSPVSVAQQAQQAQEAQQVQQAQQTQQAQKPNKPGQKPYPRPLRIGQFDFPATGPIKYSVDDLSSKNAYFGVPYSDLAWEYYLTDKDGNFYMNVNLASTIKGGQRVPLSGRGIALQLTSSPTGLVPDPKLGPDTAWSGEVGQELSTGRELKWTIPTKRTTVDFSVNEEKKRLVYKTKNKDINLKGELVSPGVQFVMPWRQDDDSTNHMFYTGTFFTLAGTYYGKKVTGYGMMSNVWAPQSYVESWWVQNRVGSWLIWGATYEDGSRESGMNWCTDNGGRGATYTNSKGETVLNTPKYNAETIKGADGKASRILYTYANGEKWELAANPRYGKEEIAPGGSSSLVTGIFRRVGEKRKMVDGFAITAIFHRQCDPIDLNAP